MEKQNKKQKTEQWGSKDRIKECQKVLGKKVGKFIYYFVLSSLAIIGSAYGCLGIYLHILGVL